MIRNNVFIAISLSLFCASSIIGSDKLQKTVLTRPIQHNPLFTFWAIQNMPIGNEDAKQNIHKQYIPIMYDQDLQSFKDQVFPAGSHVNYVDMVMFSEEQRNGLKILHLAHNKAEHLLKIAQNNRPALLLSTDLNNIMISRTDLENVEKIPMYIRMEFWAPMNQRLNVWIREDEEEFLRLKKIKQQKTILNNGFIGGLGGGLLFCAASNAFSSSICPEQDLIYKALMSCGIGFTAGAFGTILNTAKKDSEKIPRFSKHIREKSLLNYHLDTTKIISSKLKSPEISTFELMNEKDKIVRE